MNEPTLQEQLAQANAERAKAGADWDKAFGRVRQAQIDIHAANLALGRASAESERIQALLKQKEKTMKYRKKPLVVEAVQWFKLGDHPAVFIGRDFGVPTVATLEGLHIVTPGDYIITGVKGEHYPCKPDIFAMTYEPVEQA